MRRGLFWPVFFFSPFILCYSMEIQMSNCDVLVIVYVNIDGLYISDVMKICQTDMNDDNFFFAFLFIYFFLCPFLLKLKSKSKWIESNRNEPNQYINYSKCCNRMSFTEDKKKQGYSSCIGHSIFFIINVNESYEGICLNLLAHRSFDRVCRMEGYTYT